MDAGDKSLHNITTPIGTICYLCRQFLDGFQQQGWSDGEHTLHAECASYGAVKPFSNLYILIFLI